MKKRFAAMLLLSGILACSLTGCVFFKAKKVEASITASDAQQIAAEHFGLDADKCVFEKTELEDGLYDVEFTCNGREFEAKIIASSGTVVKIDSEDGYKIGTEGETGKVIDSSDVQSIAMTEDEAKRIAFAHLGLNEEDCTVKSIVLDNGSYEIEFTCNGKEYDVEVHTRSGRVTELDIDRDRD